MADLRRFLVVGCGGSGAATLAHMMDELRSELAAHGIDDIPSGWQFVDVDVPVTPQSIGSGVPNVQNQGGTYIGLGQAAGTYRELDNQLSTSPNYLERFGPWALRDPERWNISIAQGAGQVRAVGRMVTVNSMRALHEALKPVWDALNSGHDDMYRVADALGATYHQGADPLVFIVSSMAGGAGASMALDVARVLTMLPNYPTMNVGLFVVAADVFNNLPASARAGVRPNSLAMLGEIVATQTGAAAKSDLQDLAAFGLPVSQGTPVPFKRVFPVSGHVGANGAPFGSGQPMDVYRGLARGLAALMTSPSAAHQYEVYDLANHANVPTFEKQIGWSVPDIDLEWGSFGYCSLNMGRERYAEYSAQRLARGSVLRLLDGHLVYANAGEDGAAALRKLREQRWPRVVESIGVYEPQQGSFRKWMGTVLWEARSTTREMVDVAGHLTAGAPAADGQDGGQWLTAVRAMLARTQDQAAKNVQARVRTWAWDYQQALSARVLSTVRDSLKDYGIPHTLDLLNAMRTAFGQMSTAAAGEVAPVAALSVSDKLVNTVGALGKGRVANGQSLMDELRDGLARLLQGQLYGYLAHAMREVWRDFAENFLAPLERELASKQKMLLTARGKSASRETSLAVVATDEFAQWPDPDKPVPVRFDQAFNELLITSSAEYLRQFDSDIKRAFGEDKPGLEDDAWPQIISGEWMTGDGTLPPGGLIELHTEWVPSFFDTDPTSGKALVARSLKAVVQVLPHQILDRARGFVDRRDMSFHQFCNQSLVQFIDSAPEEEVAERRALIVDRFRSALNTALPLAGVNSGVLNRLTGGVKYRYKFSQIPFLNDQDLNVALLKVVESNPDIDQQVVQRNLDDAMGDSETIKRIDVFGSYPNYVPIAFSSVLLPIREQWASSTGATSRREFWSGRRTRFLPASLPMGDDERRAMVGGWFVGQITGKLTFTDVEHVGQTETVRVYDTAAGEWLTFPEPLLSPFDSRRSRADLLPSVLESYLLAVMNSGLEQGRPFESLKPYHALRRLYDAHVSDVTLQGLRAMEIELAEALRGGSPFLQDSRVEGLQAGATVEERTDVVREWLTQRRAQITSMGPSRPTTRSEASWQPLLHDLVPDILWAFDDMLGRLDGIAQRAATAASGQPPAQSGGPVADPFSGVF